MKILSSDSYRPHLINEQKEEEPLPATVLAKIPALETSSKKIHCEPKDLDSLDVAIRALFSATY